MRVFPSPNHAHGTDRDDSDALHPHAFVRQQIQHDIGYRAVESSIRSDCIRGDSRSSAVAVRGASFDQISEGDQGDLNEPEWKGAGDQGIHTQEQKYIHTDTHSE